jgi:branched-chain amino acid transport system permease protein
LNNRTTVGKRMTATATNPMAASLSGVNVTLMITISFVISAVIGAIGGVAISSYVGGMTYAYGGMYGMMGFIAAVLGGWGSSSGAVVGGLVLGIAQALATGIVPAGYKNVVAFIILLIVVYFRPQGLLGKSVPEGEA